MSTPVNKNRKRCLRTYGVAGLMEWMAQVPVGGGRSVEVPFTGGQLTGFGVAPATFSTADPVLQRYIEMSPDFRRGRIFVCS